MPTCSAQPVARNDSRDARESLSTERAVGVTLKATEVTLHGTHPDGGGHMARLSAVLLLLCCSMTSTLEAQAGWLPRTVAMGPNLTGPNRAAAIARLESIERLVKQVPELAHPSGFEIKPSFSGGRRRNGLNQSEHAGYVVAYQYVLTFSAPRFAPNIPATGTVVIGVNADENVQGWIDPQGRDVIVEQTRWPRVPGSVVTYGVSGSGTVQPREDFTLWAWFTPGGELPWRAMSREDYYNALIAHAEGNAGEKRAQIQKATEKTGYEQWLDGAAQRKKEREETLKAVAQYQPAAEVAKLRKALEDGEREAGEQLTKSEPDDRARAKSAFEPTDGIRAELNRMTPAQRRLPAILDTDPARTEWRATGATMRDRDTLASTVHRVLTPNYDFWRARRSPVEMRTINVYLEASDSPAIREAVYQMYRKFDWRALAALLDQPGN